MPEPLWRAPTNDVVEAILARRIDDERHGVGLIAGLIDAAGARVVTHGRTRQGAGARPLDADTVFEIGSVTKAFTGLALAQLAVRGTLGLEDPAGRWLPAGVASAGDGERPMTLLDLARHTSGLVRDPPDHTPADRANPYAAYTTAMLYRDVADTPRHGAPGTAYLYSNLGAGLLGDALGRAAGLDYDGLVRNLISGPLGMRSTAITPTRSMAARLAAGHDDRLEPTSPWDLPAIAGAGAVRSTAGDLLTFLAAHIGLVETPLAAAMAVQRTPRGPTDWPDRRMGLGWMITTVGARRIVHHNGGTGGFRSFVGFDHGARLGVVVLGNAALWRDDDIGLHLLTGRPLAPAPRARTVVNLEDEALERLVGDYRFSSSSGATVLRRGRRLFVRLAGHRAAHELFAENETTFFMKVVDAQVAFTLDGERAAGFVARQDGRDRVAVRID